MYNLTPKFLQFKLFRPKVQNSRYTKSFRKHLLTRELQRHKDLAQVSIRQERQLWSNLKLQLNTLACCLVKKFLEEKKKQEKSIIIAKHKKKLSNLGLSHMGPELKVVRNLSKRRLSDSELNLLNKGLDHVFFPSGINLNKIRAEFEYLYSCLLYTSDAADD